MRPMVVPPMPANEVERQRALDTYAILDTLPESEFDEIVQLASEICGVPVGLMTLIDRGRQWVKASHGIELVELPREIAFCAHAILDDRPTVIADASLDPRFADNPLVTGETHVRFYAAHPLHTPDGFNLGTL